MQKVLNLYKNAYGGLSRAAWMLAVVMLINRAGSMVLPFMSIYLTQSLNYSIRDTGVILTGYGLGAMGGSLLGGWLSDRIGNFWVQFLSLILGGSLMFIIPLITQFELLLPVVFLTSLTIECLRPANTDSVASYSRPENVTRSFSLNRMAINLGFSIGPALGGLLASRSYSLLFYADGISCMLAGIFFFFYFRNKTPRKRIENDNTLKPSGAVAPYKDLSFIGFVTLVAGFAIIFFQIFNTLPLYYREVHHLSETTIGGLMALNGLIVFLFEMILVNYLEPRISIRRMIVVGTFLCGLSFALLNLSAGIFILVAAMFLLSFSEILAMPFMVTYVVKRAGDGKKGAYIGMYSFAWASAFMLAPFLGTRIIAQTSFEILWWITTSVGLIIAILFYYNLRNRVKTEPESN